MNKDENLEEHDLINSFKHNPTKRFKISFS